MSAFLGKIHYWLYNKIQLHEKFIEDIINLAKSNGYNSETLLNESYSLYGLPVRGQLENEIEHSNIHGWLRERIISVESRLAYVITVLLKNNVVKREELGKSFYENGLSIMKELKINEDSPQGFFRSIYDYMLEGMPCDRVNEVIENSETIIVWKTTRDIHKEYWDRVGGDVEIYHYLKDSWIQGFLSESSTEYKYSRKENGINKIEKCI